MHANKLPDSKYKSTSGIVTNIIFAINYGGLAGVLKI